MYAGTERKKGPMREEEVILVREERRKRAEGRTTWEKGIRKKVEVRGSNE